MSNWNFQIHPTTSKTETFKNFNLKIINKSFASSYAFLNDCCDSVDRCSSQFSHFWTSVWPDLFSSSPHWMNDSKTDKILQNNIERSEILANVNSNTMLLMFDLFPFSFLSFFYLLEHTILHSSSSVSVRIWNSNVGVQKSHALIIARMNE